MSSTPKKHTLSAESPSLAEKPEVCVVFLGEVMSEADYELACRNLREFFDLLHSWQEGDTDEPSKCQA